MDLKTRYKILYFMIITATSPLYSCLDYFDGLKMRDLKIKEYGEILSSVEEDALPYKLSRQVPFEKSGELQQSVKEKKLTDQLQVTENDQEDTTIAFSTKCTTDKIIKIEDEYKPDTSKENPSEGGEGQGEEVTVADGRPLKKEYPSEETLNVTKVYNPPKPTKLLDHYIDDV